MLVIMLNGVLSLSWYMGHVGHYDKWDIIIIMIKELAGHHDKWDINIIVIKRTCWSMTALLFNVKGTLVIHSNQIKSIYLFILGKNNTLL